MSRIFGTDGVRGVANSELTPDLALRLGMAAAYWMARHQPAEARKIEMESVGRRDGEGESFALSERPFVIIGRDTRLSGQMLSAALSAGVTSMGLDVVDIGVVPTPAVAQMVLSRGAAAGVVISASHNPFPDNGIKFFGRDGKKLPDRVEDEIQELMERLDTLEKPTGGEIGRMIFSREPVGDYLAKAEASLRGMGTLPLTGLKLAVDCANGAAYEVAPLILRSLGAEIAVIHAEPNGVNINVHCGSTEPGDMASLARATNADAGLAFDGDADRVMLADENGVIVDGDRMMAIIGLSLKARNSLPNNVVVATIMSNVGLEKALEVAGVKLHRTAVGDRYVSEGMDELGAAIGGEQSGHILLPHVTPTGDGLVTALQVLRVMKETGKPLSELASVVVNYPQRLEKIKVKDKTGWKSDPEILAAIRRGEERLGNPVWLSVRASGTESVIRVMAQGTDKDTVDSIVDELCGLVKTKFGV
ncbi:MAG: phosphoglucosamine mutase [Chthonomonadaceae bacterium]|nr:phosphoglucosamine mutase [Chthonomonadaceae bacterium]